MKHIYEKITQAIDRDDAQQVLRTSSFESPIDSISAEEAGVYLLRVLEGNEPRRFFELLDMMGLLHVHFPELSALKVPDRHDGTAFSHTMKLLACGSTARIRFGLLCHDLGKGETPKELLPSHIGHEKRGVAVVEKMVTRLQLPDELARFGKLVAEHHERFRQVAVMKPMKIIRFYDLIPEEFREDFYNVTSIDTFVTDACDHERAAALIDRCYRIIRFLEADSSVIVEPEESSQRIRSDRLKRFLHDLDDAKKGIEQRQGF